MDNITLNGKSILSNKLAVVIAGGLIGVAGYFGINAWNGSSDSRKYDKMVDGVETAISDKNFSKAKALLDGYSERDLLKPEDIVKLSVDYADGLKADSLDKVAAKTEQSRKEKEWNDEQAAKKAEQLKKDSEWNAAEAAKKNRQPTNLEKIASMLASRKVDSAKAIFSKMKSNGEIFSKDAEDLWNQIYDNTEQGMFEKSKYFSGAEQESWLNKYLEFYPTGTHKKEVVTDLISNGASQIIELMSRNTEFKYAYPELVKFNERLVKFKDEGVKMPVKDSTLLNTIKNYIENNCVTVLDESNKRAGAIVKTIYIDVGSVQSFTNSYLNERNGLFSPGSKGIILGVNSSYAYVEFAPLNNPNKTWSTGWDYVKTFQREGKNNVAAYELKELLAISVPNDVEKARFKTEIEKMKELLESYK